MIGQSARQQQSFRRTRAKRLVLDDVPNATGKRDAAAPIELVQRHQAQIEIQSGDGSGQKGIGERRAGSVQVGQDCDGKAEVGSLRREMLGDGVEDCAVPRLHRRAAGGMQLDDVVEKGA